jgi:hypothetical protein
VIFRQGFSFRAPWPKTRFTDMSSRDFFRKDAETELREHFLAAGAVCSLSTNCQQLLQAARESLAPVKMPRQPVDFSMRIWADNTVVGTAQPSWPKPYVRGLGHLVFAGFNAQSSLLADLRNRRVIGRFSAAMAADTRYWRTIIFPMLMSVMAGSVGLVELHASCVASGEAGLILAGPSRSGKSTLAMALHAAGFRLLSDDRTFCSLALGKLLAWGLPRPIKLRREAASWFEEFRGQEPAGIQNGEHVFHFEPKQRSVPKCQPRLLVFLEQQQDHGFSMIRMNRKAAKSRVEKDLLAETPDAIRRQAECLDEILALPCCLLRYGGCPQEIAERLAATFLSRPECQVSGETKWRAS